MRGKKLKVKEYLWKAAAVWMFIFYIVMPKIQLTYDNYADTKYSEIRQEKAKTLTQYYQTQQKSKTDVIREDYLAPTIEGAVDIVSTAGKVFIALGSAGDLW